MRPAGGTDRKWSWTAWLVNKALHLLLLISRQEKNWAEVISTGFCGALDPTLKIGDIVVAGASEICSVDCVAVTVEEKQRARDFAKIQARESSKWSIRRSPK